MENDLKKLVEEAFETKAAKTADRKAKTLSFNIESYKRLQAHCREHGLIMSDVVNDLIDLYLRQVAATAKEKRVD